MTDRDKVFHLITELDAGGAQSVLLSLLQHGSSRFTHRVACLYNGDKLMAQRIRALGVPVTDVRLTALWRADAFFRLALLLRRERPFILHGWMFHGNLLARLAGWAAGVPHVITHRHNTEIGGMRRERLKRLTRRLDERVIAICELARQNEIERTAVSPDKVMTIYNGIDLAPFQQAADTAVRREFGIPDDAPLLGVVGRLHPQKGHTHLLAAFPAIRQAHPAARLLVVGDGALLMPFMALVEAMGMADSVILTGTRADVPEILAALDLFVLPSLWEGLPIVLLEAMAAGLPVAATAVGGTPELVVDGETGLLVPPADPGALATAVNRLLDDPAAARRMGQAGQERVSRHFTVRRMADQIESLYLSLL